MRGCFSHSMVSRTIPKMTTFKFKSEVIFMMYTMTERSPIKLSFQKRNNNILSYYLYSCLFCSWRGPVGLGAKVQVTEPSTSTAEQEDRQTAVFPWKFSGWGVWKDSGFSWVKINFNDWVMEAKSQLEAPPRICGSRQEGDAQGSQTAESWPRKDSHQASAFLEF